MLIILVVSLVVIIVLVWLSVLGVSEMYDVVVCYYCVGCEVRCVGLLLLLIVEWV